jgi:hypothetical protein
MSQKLRRKTFNSTLALSFRQIRRKWSSGPANVGLFTVAFHSEFERGFKTAIKHFFSASFVSIIGQVAARAWGAFRQRMPNFCNNS